LDKRGDQRVLDWAATPAAAAGACTAAASTTTTTTTTALIFSRWGRLGFSRNHAGLHEPVLSMLEEACLLSGFLKRLSRPIFLLLGYSKLHHIAL
jgi:hypothetical protein